jgi:uncharacterized membrane protein
MNGFISATAVLCLGVLVGEKNDLEGVIALGRTTQVNYLAKHKLCLVVVVILLCYNNAEYN